MAGKRKTYGAEFKAKVALEANRGELMVAERVAKHGVHLLPAGHCAAMFREEALINAWKRQAVEGMSGLFSGKAEAKAAEKEGEIEKLRAPLPGSTCLHV